MSFYFHIFIGVMLVVLQTASPCHWLFCKFYDIVIPFILYLSIFRPSLESMIIIIALGFIMDSLSGVYFGLYCTIYLWLFMGTKWVMRYVHVGDKFLLPVMMASGVFLENCIFFSTFVILNPALITPEMTSSIILLQVLLAMFTGPFFLRGFHTIHSFVIGFPGE